MMVNQTRRGKNVNETLVQRWFQRFWAGNRLINDHLGTEIPKDRRSGGNVQWRRRCRKRD